MNPQQPSQDSGVEPLAEQPLVGGEPVVAALPVIGQPISEQQAPITQMQNPGIPPAESTLTAETLGLMTSSQQPTPQPGLGALPVAPAQPVFTPSAGLAPSSPGIPTSQPSVVPPATGQSFVGGGGFEPSQIPTVGKNGSLKKIIKLIIVAVAVLVLIGAGVFGFLSWKNGQINLTIYEGDGYSVLVPEGYQKAEENDVVYFKEDTDDETTMSVVAVSQQGFGYELSTEEFKQFMTIYDDSAVEDSLQQYEGDNGGTLKNIKIDSDSTDSTLSYSGTADVENDSKNVGSMYFSFEFTKTGGSVVMVLANNSDSALANNAQKIIDSMKVE